MQGIAADARHPGTVLNVESSAVGFIASDFEATQRHSTSLRWSNEYIEVKLPTFCSGRVIRCSVENENEFSEAAVDFRAVSIVPLWL